MKLHTKQVLDVITDKMYVYVIQHAIDNHNSDESVEKFEWIVAKGELIHRRTIKDSLFTSYVRQPMFLTAHIQCYYFD